MTNTIGSIAPVAGNIDRSAAPAKAAAPATTAFTLGSPSTALSTVHSPRVIDDPSAGIITEYISANGGQVVAQIPTAVTVAYLRIGLTADGTPKKSAVSGVTA